MRLIIKKPITPSQRHLIKLDRNNISKKPLLKKDLKGLKNSSGKNHSGKITIRFRGGGQKKKYRKINFFRNNSTTAITCSIEYDPNRNSNIAAIYDFQLNNFFYIIAPQNLKVGDIIKTGKTAGIKIGHSLPLFEIPVGCLIHNIALKNNKHSQMSRSAGTFSRIIEKISKTSTKIKTSSGKHKILSSKCQTTIGAVSNELHFLTQLGKAGHSRWLRKRPKVRGVAMNPIDHPHGGGEGKKSGKGYTFWGKPTKRGKKKKYE